VLTIPTFFEILNSTFPNLKYDENSNKIQGLKLVLNVKQQIQLKNQKQFIQQPPTQSNSILANTIAKTTPITVNVIPITQPTNEQTKSNAIDNSQLSPMPCVSIHIQTPSIPLLTPPTPPVISTNVTSPLEQPKAQPATVLQTNDLNVLNSNSSEKSSSTSTEETIDKQVKKDLQVKENGITEEKLLENIESRISLIKEANCQQKQQLPNGIHKSNTETHFQNGHSNGESDEKEETSEKENKLKEEPSLVNGTCKEHSNVNSALNAAVADENSSSSTTSSLTSSSLSSTSSSENYLVTTNTNTSKKRKLSSSNNDSNETTESPKKKSLKINEMEDFTHPQTEKKPEDTTTIVEENKTQSSSSTSNNVASSALTTTTTTNSNENQDENSQEEQNHTTNNAQPTLELQQTLAITATKTTDENTHTSSGDYLCEWNNCKRSVLNSFQ
jgi:hypothetical protein